MSNYDQAKFAANVKVTQHIQARLEEMRAECPTFDDRTFAETLFLQSLGLMGRVRPFTQDAPERIKYSVIAYMLFRPELCAPEVDIIALATEVAMDGDL